MKTNAHRNARTTRPASPVRAAIESLESRQFLAADLGVSVRAIAPGPTGGPATVIGAAGTNITLSKGALVMNAVRGQTSLAAKLVIANGGTAPLSITGLTLGGTEPGSFQITSNGGLPGTLAVGASATVNVVYKPAAAATLGIHTATLTVGSNDASKPSIAVALRGLATNGTGGQNEPSLQRIFDLYQFNVATGDKNAGNTNLFSPSEPLGANNEIFVQRLVKAGAGSVTVQALGTFAGGSPAATFGYYTSANGAARTQLLSVNTAEAQSVNVNPVGATSFDPGASSFGLFANFPIFGNTAFSEDALNTSEANAANQRKMRFYPLKNADGSTVPNAFIFTSEDFFNDPSSSYDTNDFIGIIRNVKAAGTTTTGSGLATQNLDGTPFPDRLVFHRIRQQPPGKVTDEETGLPYQPPNNVVHDTASVKLTNTRSTSLTITSLSLSHSAQWKITAGPAAGTVLAPGQSVTVTLKFVATNPPVTTVNESIGIGNAGKGINGTWNGTLTVNTNDPSAKKVIDLRGYLQDRSENDQEPNLVTIVNKMFGYGTQILGAGQSLDTGGKVQAVGEEVISPYWQRADTTQSIGVRQLAAFHNQGDTGTLFWQLKTNGTQKTVMIHHGHDAQTILPRNTAGQPAAFNFAPEGVFGLKVDFERSDSKLNKQEQPGGNYGHHMRFWPARDRGGALIANTYIMAMDYLGRNDDFNDNVYILSNIKPAGGAVTPNPTGPTLSGLTLINANTDVAIGAFANGASLDLSGGKKYSVRANPGTGTIGSVIFAVDGTVVRTENAAPYHIAGETGTTDVNPWNVPTGGHSLTVTAYSGANGTGAAGPTVTVNFTASNGTNPTPTFGVSGLTLINAVTNADIGPVTNGMTIDFSGGKQYSIRANVTGTATKSVLFKVDGATVRTENTAPYAIAGDNPITGGVDYLPWSVANGARTLNVAAFDATNGAGNAGLAVTLSVNVTGVGATTPNAGTFTGININGATGSTTNGGSGTWTVKGSGAGINGVKDVIHFAQQVRNGNFDIKAKLTSLTGGAAGLVVRGGTDSGNSQVAILVNQGKISVGSRASYGANYVSSEKAAGTAGNLWLRLKRAGSVFTAYYSTNGTTWTTAATLTVSAMGTTANFGFVAMSGVPGTQATARFEGAQG